MLNAIQVARLTIGLSWIYHGLFPKLIQVATLEIEMAESVGFSLENATVIIKISGVAEILFGIVFIFFYRLQSIILINIIILSGLFLFVCLQTPHLLIGAFNPVTTNFPLIALSVILIYLYKNDKPNGVK